MDDDGGLGGRNWGGYFEQSLKGNLGLQLMSSSAEHDIKPFLSSRDPTCMVSHGGGGGFLQRNCGIPESQVPGDYVRDHWMVQREKLLHVMPNNLNYAVMSEHLGPHHHHPLQMLPQPELAKDEKVTQMSDMDVGKNDDLVKKRSNGRPCKSPKVKKPKKVAPKDERITSCPRVKTGNKNTGMVINGIDMDISGLPTPVCSCTGTPQQCYKWGVGGWQSACCTTNMSIYPLPMSPKRRGARIAGRKMSQGAFKKVLEKLINEGHNLSIPIDLKPYWAKHGTNKFVTIRVSWVDVANEFSAMFNQCFELRLSAILMCYAFIAILGSLISSIY